MKKCKIFGIGLQRTGTTSLFQALNTLGYKSAPDSIPLLHQLNHPILEQFDAFMDNPIPLIYQELDQLLPGSKFILTTRDQNEWLKSVQWLFEVRLPKMEKNLRKIADAIHLQFYGTSTFNAELFAIKWIDYHDHVYEYFKNRPDQLLILDLGKGIEWLSIGSFLGCPVPEIDFPRLNQSARYFALKKSKITTSDSNTRTIPQANPEEANQRVR